MSSWRAVAYDNIEQQTIDSHPAHGAEAGGAFVPQTFSGPINGLDNGDRLALESDIDPHSALAPNMLQQRLGAENIGLDSTDVNRVLAWNPRQRSADITVLHVQDSAAINIATNPDDGSWYAPTDGSEPLRPNAGYPLDSRPDAQYAAQTNDVIGNDANQPFPFVAPDGIHIVAEKILSLADRLSESPSSHQVPYAGWGEVLGVWPWSGDKTAMPRPIVSDPLYFDTAIPDALPSVSGAGNAFTPWDMHTISPLTFRAPPEPWDTSDPSYINSGL